MKRETFRHYLQALAAVALICGLALRGEEPAPAPVTPPAAAQSDGSAAPAQPAAASSAKSDAAPAPTPAAAPATTAPETPASTPAVAQEPAPAVAPAAPAVAPEVAAPSAEVTETPAEGLRRLDNEAPSSKDESERQAGSRSRKTVHLRHISGGDGNERVSILHDTRVDKDETAQVAVSILGSTTVDGAVRDAAVSVGGNTTVNGSTGDAAVAVMGDVRIDGTVGDAAVAVGGNVVVNGHVRGEVVSVGGDVTLGPDAEVNGDMVVVGGSLEKQPGAVIHGNLQRVRLPAISWIFAWVKSALLKGRLLSFAHGTGWAWVVAAAFLGFYVLLALLFPRAVTKCAETLEQQPGFTILAALLTMMAMPLLTVLLAITGVGALVLPFLGLGLFVGKLFGRSAMLAWYGRRITGWFGEGAFSHVAVAVLFGGVVVMLLYLVPLVAFLVFALNGFLGLGMVVYTLVRGMRRNGTKPAPVTAAVGATPAAVAVTTGGLPAAVPMAGAAPGAGVAALSAEAPPVVAAAIPPAAPVVAPVAVSAATYPRAGFWIRLGASFLDMILIGVAAALIHLPGFLLFGFTTYCVVLWALKGTTVGGIICGLKLVRLDDRPLDWSVAIVRALAGFLSLAVVGLGFIWVAFDSEGQSWHDKIAGTTIVKVPKTTSLV